MEYLGKGIITPEVWLAWSDIQNRSVSENPFIGNLTKEVGKTFAKLRNQHQSIEVPSFSPVLNKGFLTRVGLAIPLAFAFYGLSLIQEAFIQETILNGRTRNQDLVLSVTWEEITLPWKITDNWTIDQQWINDNCDNQGKSLGTGIPPEPPIKIISRVDAKSIARLWQLIPSPYKYNYSIYTQSNVATANSYCEVFGKPTQPIL
ncbi:MAG: hypothetical protein Q7R49_01345 [Candidatus Daviesbacteria bacterium]|nr:hypothetical protein [Candidatus Daviesbacteria bacterium]